MNTRLLFTSFTFASLVALACSNSSSGNDGSTAAAQGCSAGGQSSGTVPSAACTSCIQSSCASESSALHSSCSAFYSCISGCACSDTTCLQACDSKKDAACMKAANAYLDCFAGTCASPCLSGQGGATSAGGSSTAGGSGGVGTGGSGGVGTGGSGGVGTGGSGGVGTGGSGGVGTGGSGAGNVTTACYNPTSFSCTQISTIASVIPMYEMSCKQQGGTVSGTCPEAKVVGCCKVAGTTELCYYMGGSVDAATGMSSCMQQSGTWSATPLLSRPDAIVIRDAGSSPRRVSLVAVLAFFVRSIGLVRPPAGSSGVTASRLRSKLVAT
jgi:hypothetical protein